MHRILRVLLVLLAVVSIVRARAAVAQALVPGGGPAKSDCYGEWLSAAPNRGATGIDCEDGDPACDLDRSADGTCLIATGICLHIDNVARCTAPAIRQVTVRSNPKRVRKDLSVVLPTAPAAPVSVATCGADAVITLPLRTDRKGHQKPSKRITLRMVTIAAGSPRKDRDHLKLRCSPNTGAGSCGANPAGGPAELRMVASGSGSDLDVGWTGTAHSFGIIANATVRLCLGSCGSTANAQCSERETETAAVNRDTFGAPLPLLASGIAVCVVNRFGSPALTDFTADVATGSVAGTIALASQAFRTSLTQVCPRCSGSAPGDTGICDSGARQGRACVTAGLASVPGAQGSSSYALSADCPPAGEPLGTTALEIPVITATAALPGPHPCGAAQDDDCAGGSCSVPCTGTACASTVDGQCVDVKGGLSQLCCSTDPQRPCFATASGVPIARAGSATAPESPFGNPSYPKVGELTLVGTFCAPASGSPLVDAIVGLPGPGAIVLPMATAWGP
jgi:hypothetical protein